MVDHPAGTSLDTGHRAGVGQGTLRRVDEHIAAAIRSTHPQWSLLGIEERSEPSRRTAIELRAMLEARYRPGLPLSEVIDHIVARIHVVMVATILVVVSIQLAIEANHPGFLGIPLGAILWDRFKRLWRQRVRSWPFSKYPYHSVGPQCLVAFVEILAAIFVLAVAAPVRGSVALEIALLLLLPLYRLGRQFLLGAIADVRAAGTRFLVAGLLAVAGITFAAAIAIGERGALVSDWRGAAVSALQIIIVGVWLWLLGLLLAYLAAGYFSSYHPALMRLHDELPLLGDEKRELERLLNATRHLAGADFAILYRYDEKGDSLDRPLHANAPSVEFNDPVMMRHRPSRQSMAWKAWEGHSKTQPCFYEDVGELAANTRPNYKPFVIREDIKSSISYVLNHWVGGRGVLFFSFRSAVTFDEPRQAWLRQICHSIEEELARILERARDRQAAVDRLRASEEAFRRNIDGRLHEEVKQVLVANRRSVQDLLDDLRYEPTYQDLNSADRRRLRGRLETIDSLAQEAILRLETIHEPEIPTTLTALAESLNWSWRRSRYEHPYSDRDLDLSGFRLSDEPWPLPYRELKTILSEVVINVAKHSGGSFPRIEVVVYSAPVHELVFIVSDDGAGAEEEERLSCERKLRQHGKDAGIKIEVISAIGKGMKVICRVPEPYDAHLVALADPAAEVVE